MVSDNLLDPSVELQAEDVSNTLEGQEAVALEVEVSLLAALHPGTTSLGWFR